MKTYPYPRAFVAARDRDGTPTLYGWTIIRGPEDETHPQPRERCQTERGPADRLCEQATEDCR